MMVDDSDGQMIFGDLGGLKLPDIRLTGEEKPRKNSPRKLVPNRDRTRVRCVADGSMRAWTILDYAVLKSKDSDNVGLYGNLKIQQNSVPMSLN